MMLMLLLSACTTSDPEPKCTTKPIAYQGFLESKKVKK